MKRIIILIMAAMLAIAMLAGCAAGNGGGTDETGGEEAGKKDTPAGTQYVLEVLDSDMLAIYEARTSELPAAVVYTFQGEGGSVESPLYGEEAVNSALDAIEQLYITGETDITVSDYDFAYSFLNADGTEAGSVSFNAGNLEAGEKKYEVGGAEALKKLSFPADDSRDMLYCDGPDASVAELLERSSSELPEAVRVESSALGDYEITDKDIIGELINSLYTVGISFAWKGEDEAEVTRSIVFVMSDETEYRMTFADDAFIYEYPQPLGKWSFYSVSAEYFFEMLDSAS